MDVQLQEQILAVEKSINVTFLVIMAIIIFFMQAGFAFLEAGSVRAKNTTNILVKNVVDAVLGTFIYWATGYAFGFGSQNNEFIGTNKFFLINTESSEYANFFFQYVFAVTSATIISGAIAERTHLTAYLLISIVMTGFCYPVVTHWVWNDGGWLNELSYVDFAGSSVVHCVGGAAAFTGAVIVGPRIGRFDKNGKVLPIPGHSTVLVTLGYFILWFGFFAFNGGSEGGIAGPGFSPNNVARAVVNTSLAAAAGTLSAILFLKLGVKKEEFHLFHRDFKSWTIFGGYWSLTGGVNGGLCGMVSICAGANIVEPWAAWVIGCVAGVVYCCWVQLILHLRVDDPVNATSVHLGGGIWGTLAAVIFCNSDRLEALPEGGILYQGNADAFILFGVQCIGVACIISWSCLCSTIVFGSLRLFGLLRVTPEAEEDGLDYINGEPAYPIDPAILGTSYSDDSNYQSDEDLPRT